MAEMHDKFMKTSFLFADESKCVSYHVGAVIVKDKRIISIGYNGTPPGMPNCCEIFDKDNFDREEHHKWSKANEIHAEMNAIGFAAKKGEDVDGCDMYITTSPCNDCLKNVSAAGIKNIYYLYLYDKEPLNPELLKVVNVKEIPGSNKIKKWVDKNGYNYISTQRNDKIILEWYMKGFNDELAGKLNHSYKLPIYEKAYKLGKIDARMGDDNPNLDYRSDAIVLNDIKTLPIM